MSLIDLLRAHNIDVSQAGSPNVGPGWIGMQCCYCSDRSNHLGFNLKYGYFRCWKCGYHPFRQTVLRLVGLPTESFAQLVRDYELFTHSKYVKAEVKPTNIVPFKFPHPTGAMQSMHKQYLDNRRFNANKIEEMYNVLGTGPVAELDGTSFKFRIIIPIYWNGSVVSFQSRDITDKQALRYVSCPMQREKLHYKHILYGKQDEWSRLAFCVEGITDVWRLGSIAFATFGTAVTDEQVLCMREHFDKIFVLFDPEVDAQKLARKLTSRLISLGVDATNVDLHDYYDAEDVGSLTNREARQFVNQILK